jgi:competence ComEA-like helix-hairpin-helix protein
LLRRQFWLDSPPQDGRRSFPKARGAEESVKAMIGYGAELTPDEQKIVVAFLAKYFGEQVNVNKASAADLQREFELSEKEAEAVVQTRKDKGPFKGWDDLGKVPGLDLKKLEDLRDRIQYN